jgi:hypothetical protein
MPKWTRNRAFPFSEIADNYLIIMFISSTIAWLLALLLVAVGFSYTKIHDDTWQNWKSYIFSFAFLFFLRSAILVVFELAFWGRWLARFTQQRWAASFYDTTAAPGLLSSQGPSILITIPTYILNFIFGGVLLLCWVFANQDWMIWAGGSLILEPVLKLPIEWGLRRNVAILGYDLKNHWILMSFTGVGFLKVALVISEGFRSHKSWKIGLGLLILVLYPIWLWIDGQRGYSRWICTVFLGEDEDKDKDD